MIAGRIAMTQVEAHTILAKEPGWLWLTARLGLKYMADFAWRRRTRRDRRLTLGNALVASLRVAMQARQIELWLQAPMRRLLSHGAR